MYLEWGTGWIRGHNVVASDHDKSFYFVLFDWESPLVTLIKRTVAEAEELDKIPLPKTLFDAAWHEDGKVSGGSVHRINQQLKEYLQTALHSPPVDFSIATH